MPKLTSFSIDGLDLWFWSNDHEPPHFHARRKGEWEVRVKFLESGPNMFEAVRPKKCPMGKGDRKALQEMVEAHRAEILNEWEKKVQKS